MYVSRKEFHSALAAVWEQLEQFESALKQQLEKEMTDFTTALSDLDSALSSLEGDVTNLQQQIAAGNQAATAAAATQLEQRVAGIRTFLAGPPATPTPTPTIGGTTTTAASDTGTTTTTPASS
jgi:septal ring factor EnvC (AmiA/AmiB activator)